MNNQQPTERISSFPEHFHPDIIEIGGVKYQRVEEQKPQTLYERLSNSLDGTIIVCDSRLKDIICTIVSNWLPNQLEHKSIDSYSSGWNDCLNRLRLTLK